MPVEIKSYPPNSDKSKSNTAEQKIEYNKPQFTGKISVKHASEASRQVKARANEIKRYTLQDVLLPGLKDAAWDILTTALNIILYGESDSRGPNRSIHQGYTSYSSMSTGKRNAIRPNNRNVVTSVKARPEDEIIFERRADADMALDALREAVATYGVVTVQSLFDYCQKTAPFTANKYGWMDLEDAGVERVREGYILRLPKSLPLD